MNLRAADQHNRSIYEHAYVSAYAPVGWGVVANSECLDVSVMNAINIIAPYKHHGMWVFDDPRVGLTQEPFVAGADSIIDRMVAQHPEADRGFTLIFSGTPFPGHQYSFEWRREEDGGNWYYAPQFDIGGWLCPALFQYFPEAPNQLFVALKSVSPD